MQEPWEIVWDIEANNLLNSESIDYTSIPYKLKDSFKIHCIVVLVKIADKEYLYGFHNGPKYLFDGREHSLEVEGFVYKLEKGYIPVDYIHKQLDDFPKFVKALPENSKVIAHNQINYDLLAVKLYWGIPYAVEVDADLSKPLGDDYWDNKKVVFDDTLVRSKTLNPDRFGGHSLDNLSQKGDAKKLAFREYLPKEDRFKHFGPDMLYYNIWDVKANKSVAKQLDEEMKLYGWGNKWDKALKLEKAVAELITRQEHRGFKFNTTLAQSNLDELDKLMEERKVKIEAIIPKRPATKKVQGEYTPPKNQFKKNGELAANIIKFAEKIGATIEDRKFIFNGQCFDLPLEEKPLVTEMVATVNDTTHIKEWLVSLGWTPSEYKEKDLTTDTKKNRLSDEKIKAAILRYVEQTIESNFCNDRCEHLGISVGPRMTKESIRSKLMQELLKRTERRGGIKVLTNPSFTVGQEKEICPNLQELSESKEELNCITDITEYLTYRHRRNSILGGGADWDDDEEPEKGYLSAVREDGRIPTPADTCGAATSRFKHRLVTNIPRVTSLYGYNMRAMFGVDDSCYQIGYDFDSLEAREEANFCWKYEAGANKEYCNSLLLDKPNDVHTKMAQKISTIIAREFARGPAKSVKYGATYGAQGPKIAKTIGCDVETGNQIFEAFWQAAAPLKKLKDALNKEWGEFDKKKIIGIDGRLVPTRSAHAILNSKFQSAGVICAKRAMVLHDRKLKAAGLLVDFFAEDWTKKDFCQQLIAYHDEAQLETNKASVKFKMFKTKEEAQDFKDIRLAQAGEIWSDIKDSPKGGVYVAYCKGGHLAVESVNQSGKDYGMVIDLTAGYMIEKSWAGCH